MQIGIYIGRFVSVERPLFKSDETSRNKLEPVIAGARKTSRIWAQFRYLLSQITDQARHQVRHYVPRREAPDLGHRPLSERKS
jgi:hypothetical protein